MKIHVDRLSATPTPFAFELGEAWWRGHMAADRGLPEAPDGPLRVGLEAHEMGEDLYLEGVVEAAFPLECSRCLARYRHALRESFRLVLEPAGARAPADPEAAEALARDGLCLGDEDETGWYRGTEIHLDAVCGELISLSLPVKPLCREDCAGLCARCGADRNQDPCDCVDEVTDSPFAVLAALRDEGTEGVH